MAKLKIKKLDNLLSFIAPFKTWILVAFIITVFSGLIYVVVQQDIRGGANDPQIQISEDVAENLAQGGDPTQIIPNYTFDIGKSLSTFVIVTDATGKVLATTASLDGKTPQIPKGILDFTKAHTQDRLTWQPKTGVRTAIVVTYFDNLQGKTSGFVIVGRSLREIEKRESTLELEVGLAWLIGIVGSLVIFLNTEGKKIK